MSTQLPRKQFIRRVTRGYILFAVAWILLADPLLLTLTSLHSAILLTIAKGLIFILITAIALFTVLRTVPEPEETKQLNADILTLAQQAMHNSVARFSAIFNAVPTGIALIHIEDGTIADANPAFLSLFGYTRADVIGQFTHEFLSRFNASHLAALLTPDHADGQINETEIQYTRRDGAAVHVEISVTYLSLEGRRFVLAMLEDVTKRKLAETALRENQVTLHRMTDHVPVALFVYIRHSNNAVSMEYLSPGIADLLEVSVEDGLADIRNLFAVIHPEDRDLYFSTMEHSRHTLAPLFLEYRVVTASGKTKWLQTRAKAVVRENQEVAWHGMFLDVSEQKWAETELRNSERFFATLATVNPVGIFQADKFGRYQYTNKRWSEITGISSEAAIAQDWPNAIFEADRERILAEWEKASEEKRNFSLEYRFQKPDGALVWVLGQATAIQTAAGEIESVIGTIMDITQQKLGETEINQLAFYDALTQLPNRRLLQDRLQQAIVGCARNRRHGALLFIDLDNFKTLNDTSGHDKGDQVLQLVAPLLIASVRASDTVARLGGDEFVLVLEDLSEHADEAAAQAKSIGETVLSKLNQTHRFANHEYHCTGSIGITLFKLREDSVDDLMKQADLAMYQAKAAGRNTLRFFDPAMESMVSARAASENALAQAIAEQQFVLFYQAQVSENGRVTGAEALIRWQHPSKGMVFPNDFIPLAEETGLILPLGNWVLEAGCKQLVEWAKHPATHHLTLAVNVSALQFRQPDFVETVMHILHQTGVNPNRLKLELTESLLVADVEDIINKMTTLKPCGIHFSLDDFGTGYSSLYYLKRLPLDQLKIDRSFVQDILIDHNDAAIARTIVALAQSLGLAVIAEGVETADQRDFLVANGCNYFQGYFFGKPIPLAAFEAQFND